MCAVGALAAALPWASAPIALAAGMALGLSGLVKPWGMGRRVSKWLIQACVVALGFRLDVSTLWASARDGFGLALATIGGGLALGLALGRLLRADREVSLLVSVGTAICGGSAIAAVGAAVGAAAPAMAVATGAIFILNAAGLYVLPALGQALELTPPEFGLWAGVAIHDVSSVVGAATQFDRAVGAGGVALDSANVAKLTRVVWILPIVLAAGWWASRRRGGGKSGPLAVPWFIGLFLLASAARTFWPELAALGPQIKLAASAGFQAALFLIGLSLTREALRAVGWRAMALATVLWLTLAGGTLGVILIGRG